LTPRGFGFFIRRLSSGAYNFFLIRIEPHLNELGAIVVHIPEIFDKITDVKNPRLVPEKKGQEEQVEIAKQLLVFISGQRQERSFNKTP